MSVDPGSHTMARDSEGLHTEEELWHVIAMQGVRLVQLEGQLHATHGMYLHALDREIDLKRQVEALEQEMKEERAIQAVLDEPLEEDAA